MRLIRSSLRLFRTFDFTFLDKAFFLGTDALEEHRCWLIVGVLRYKFTMYRKVKYLLA